MKPRIAIVRGKFLNRYEMQSYEPLAKQFDITAFGSLTPYQDRFTFPVVKLPSPMDLPEFPYKMPLLNRIFIDAHYLVGLEKRLQGFDLVHSAETYYHYTQQALNAKRRGYVKRVIATALENIPFNNERIWGRKSFKKRARAELDHIIALTHKTKEALIMEGCEHSKITVIGLGVDTKVFHPPAGQQKRLVDTRRKELNLLFVGRLEKEKGIFDLLQAFRWLLGDSSIKGLDFKLSIVGDGSEKPRLVQTIAAYDLGSKVNLTKRTYQEMPRVYQAADIFVAPSKATPTWQEQWGMVLTEAQAAGLPIVTTASGSIPENVGEAAILISPGNPAQLVNALKSFLTSPPLRRIYGQKARARAETVHDARIVADKIARVYERVLDTSQTQV